MTSHLSRSCSVRARSHPSWRLATAASSVLVGLGSSRAGERWAGPASPPLHAATVRAPFAFLAVWGTEPGLSQPCLQPAGLRELGLDEDTGGRWEWAGQRVSMVTAAVPPGGTTFRAWVISPRNRPVARCPLPGVSPHWEVQDTL